MPGFVRRIRQLTSRLTFRITAFGVVFFMSGVIARLLFVSSTLEGSLLGVTTSQLESMASYAAADIDAKLMQRQALLVDVAGDLSELEFDNRAAVAEWLDGKPASSFAAFSSGLLLLAPEGEVLAWVAGTPVSALQPRFKDADWLVAVRARQTPVLGAPVVLPGLHGGLIPQAVPVKSPQGRLKGVLVGWTAIGSSGFLDLIERQGIGRAGGFLLVSPQDGLFLASSSADMRLKPLPPPGVNTLHDQAMKGWRGTGRTVNAKGVDELVGVAGVESTGWFVVARVPASEAFEPVKSIENFVLLNALVMTFILIPVLVLVMRHMLRPLGKAASAMHRMAEGEDALRPLEVVRHDEVGEMVQSFNRLLERLRDSESKLVHLAHHDSLAGLPNRHAALDRMPQCLALAARMGTGAALMFIDIDGFKPVNDQHGHETGDQLLAAIGRRLAAQTRQSDVLARVGGDEFLLLLNDVRSQDEVATVATKLVALLSEPFDLGAVSVSIGASIGIALYPQDGADIDSLIAKADTAMYAVKRAGKSAYAFAQLDARATSPDATVTST